MNIKQTLNKYQYNNRNPFMDEVLSNISEGKQIRKYAYGPSEDIVDANSGETFKRQTHVFKKTTILKDRQEWAKTYFDSMMRICDINRTSVLLWKYIMEHIEYDTDIICLNPDIVQADSTISRASVYRSIIELLDKCFIAKSGNAGCYYINPAISFKGDRLLLVQEYLIESDKEIKEGTKELTPKASSEDINQLSDIINKTT